MKYILILVIISFTNTFLAQCKKNIIEGRVVDTNSIQQFYNLIIYNKSSNVGIFGKPDGTFNVEVKNNDTLIVSVVGYDKLMILTKDLSFKDCKSILELTLKVQSKQLKTVVIHPIKTIQQIKEEREKLSKKESKKMVEGIAVLKSPITALYERYSKRAKTIKRINELKYEDEMQKILKELLSLYVDYDIITLSEVDFDRFILFLNLNDEILKNTSDIELATFIKDKFIHFKTLNQTK